MVLFLLQCFCLITAQPSKWEKVADMWTDLFSICHDTECFSCNVQTTSRVSDMGGWHKFFLYFRVISNDHSWMITDIDISQKCFVKLKAGYVYYHVTEQCLVIHGVLIIYYQLENSFMTTMAWWSCSPNVYHFYQIMLPQCTRILLTLGSFFKTKHKN